MNKARLLLAKVRGGDYTHAGEREAVYLVMEKLPPELKQGHCLDVGCGLGGTANDVYNLGFKHVWGIDRDGDAISYARSHYPEIKFFEAEAEKAATLFQPSFFSFVYLFNVLYAIEDKKTVLKALAAVAKPGAMLAIFDYTEGGRPAGLIDLEGGPTYPIHTDRLKKDLDASGWELLEIVDLSKRYITWYKALLKKLSEKREVLSQEFAKADVERVERTFKTLLSLLESSSLGGAVVYARRNLT